jgi:hypothetical protein
LLQQSLEVRPSFLCRGMEGELILSFKNCPHSDKVKIEVSEIDMDTYIMTFYRFSMAPENRGCQVVKVIKDVSRKHLQHSFEAFTGLFLGPK